MEVIRLAHFKNREVAEKLQAHVEGTWGRKCRVIENALGAAYELPYTVEFEGIIEKGESLFWYVMGFCHAYPIKDAVRIIGSQE